MSPSTATVCPQFLKGSCRRGKACKLKHTAPKSNICTYYLRNACVYGDKCERLHTKPSSGSKSGASSASESKKRKAQAPAPKTPTEEQCAASDTPAPGTSKVDEESKQKKPPCIFYMQGVCGQGDDCTFAHGIVTSSSNESGLDMSDTIPKTNSPPRKKSEICKHFVRGKCLAGDTCRLKHVQAPNKTFNVSGSESSDGPANWGGSYKSPSEEMTGISASGGPEAEDQNIPLFDDNTHTEEKMDQQDAGTKDADDIYNDEDNNALTPIDGQDEDNDDKNSNNEEDEYAEQNGDVGASQSKEEDNEEDSNEGDTTIKDDPKLDKPAVSSEYTTSASTKGSRRGSWYGYGSDEKPLSTQSGGSSLHIPSPALRPRSLAVPQSVQAVAPPAPASSSVQPHWSQFADPLANAQLPFCKPHAQGICMQGTGCRYRHFLTPEEYTLLFHDPQPNLWTFEPPAVQAISPQQLSSPLSNSYAAVNQTGNGNVPNLSSPFAQECKFYGLGTCRNGDRCPFAHTQHPVPSEHTNASTDNYERGNSSYRGGHDKFDSPCRFFIQKGYCSRGDECKFRHDGSTETNEFSSGWGNGDDKKDDNGKDEESSPWDPNGGDASGWDNAGDNNNGWGTAGDNNKGWDTAGDNSKGWDTADDNKSGWDAPADSWGTSTKNTCHRFSQDGTCRFGDNCKFSHDVKPEEKKSGGDEWPPEEDSKTASWVASTVACRYYAEGNCLEGDKCPNSHDPPPEHKSKEKSGGEECNSGGNDWPAETKWDSDALDTNDDDAPVAPSSIAVVCVKFLRRGVCDDSDCLYNHDKPSDNGPTDPVAAWGADAETEGQHLDTEQDGEDKEPQETEIQDAQDQHAGIDQIDPIILEHPLVVRFWEQCNVEFGEDITPQAITSLTDTKKVILSNLHPDVSPDDVKTLANQYGKVQEMLSLDDSIDTAAIQIEFADVLEAYNAFKNLDGKEYESQIISATLKGARNVLKNRSVGQKIYAKVSWPKPNKRVWVHYTSVTKAKQQVETLNNVIIRGRVIKTSFVPPKKAQKTAFAILLENVDPETTQTEIAAVCSQHELVTMNPPNYLANATDHIKFLFDDFGQVEQFDVLPDTTGATSSAFATFTNETAAAAITKRLDASSLNALGKESLTIRCALYARYCVTKAQFEAVKTEVDNLIEQCNVANKCDIRYDDHRSGQLVLVRIYSSYEYGSQFAEMNTALRYTLQGVIMMSEGKELWDSYFEISSGINALNHIETRTSTLIQCDHRGKRIRIFGCKADLARAQTMITKMLSKVHDALHEIDLPRHKLHPLINGMLTTLQNSIGVNKVSLDVIASKLIIRGTSTEVSQANDAIASLAEPSPASDSHNTCQICHHTAVSPIRLSCHHAYCKNCLQFAIRPPRSAPFLCVADRTSPDGESVELCSAHVPYIVLQNILSTEIDDVLRESLYAYVRSKPHEYFFCPSLNCSAVHRARPDRGVNIKCTLCISEICTHCKSLAHIGTPCPVPVNA